MDRLVSEGIVFVAGADWRGDWVMRVSVISGAISVDVFGFSRLMGADEDGIQETFKRLQKTIVSPEVLRHQGRIAKLMGDGSIIVFASVVDAVAAATALQEKKRGFNKEIPPKAAVPLRIGINLGDVILVGADIFGGGVNVAARIQEICTPGGVALNANAYQHVSAKIDAEFTDVGERVLTNIQRKVCVFVDRRSKPMTRVRR